MVLKNKWLLFEYKGLIKLSKKKDIYKLLNLYNLKRFNHGFQNSKMVRADRDSTSPS